MKKLVYFAVTMLVLLACTQSPMSGKGQGQGGSANDTIVKSESHQLPAPLHPRQLFTLAEAEKILGETAQLTDSSSKSRGVNPGFIDSMSGEKKKAAIYSCGYKADSRDMKTGKTGTVYFTCEQYPEVSSAQKVYAYYMNANKDMGIEVLHKLGDEAYFHTDKQNFYFVMVRKGNIVYNMKVNKITSKTSLDEFNLVAGKIAGAL